MNAKTEEKKLSMTEAIQLWEADKTAQKQGFLARVIRQKYVPYLVKLTLTQKMLEQAHTIVADGKVLGYEQNLVKQRYLYNIMIVSEYTRIDVTNGSATQNYDVLEMHDIIYRIKKAVENDLAKWDEIVDLASKDFAEKHFTTRSFMQDICKRVVSFVAKIGSQITDAFVSKVNEIAENSDLSPEGKEELREVLTIIQGGINEQEK